MANDGQTIFSATRSKGQIEEGPVGYSLVTIDEGKVSWRFKLLDEPFPYVMITASTDYRLIREKDQKITQTAHIKATIFGSKAIKHVKFMLENRDWFYMDKNSIHSYQATEINVPDTALTDLTVMATNETARPGIHQIRLATPLFTSINKAQNGSNKNSIGAWPENGIFGTQLGTNQNGKPSS